MDAKKEASRMGGLGVEVSLILTLIGGWLMFVALVSFTIHFILPIAVNTLIPTIVIGVISAVGIAFYVRKKRNEERLESEEREAKQILDSLETFKSQGYDDEASRLSKLYEEK